MATKKLSDIAIINCYYKKGLTKTLMYTSLFPLGSILTYLFNSLVPFHQGLKAFHTCYIKHEQNTLNGILLNNIIGAN